MLVCLVFLAFCWIGGKMREPYIQNFNTEGLTFYRCEENFIEAQDYVYGPIVRISYVIECCTGGFGYFTVNGKEFRFEEGDCYVLLPGDKVAHRTTSQSSRTEVSCYIGGAELEKAVAIAGITSDSPFVPRSLYHEIFSAITHIIELSEDLSIGADYQRTAEIYRIMSALVRGKNRTESTSIIHKAIGFIESKYYENMTVDDIAKSVGLERSYFSVLFREHTGQSPHAYLTSVRIHRAQTLLTGTELPLSEIALQVGLEPAGFSRIFKRTKGITPSEYRKNPI